MMTRSAPGPKRPAARGAAPVHADPVRVVDTIEVRRVRDELTSRTPDGPEVSVGSGVEPCGHAASHVVDEEGPAPACIRVQGEAVAAWGHADAHETTWIQPQVLGLTAELLGGQTGLYVTGHFPDSHAPE
jgi:hypothetical protein